jgi:hypothetical protein
MYACRQAAVAARMHNPRFRSCWESPGALARPRSYAGVTLYILLACSCSQQPAATETRRTPEASQPTPITLYAAKLHRAVTDADDEMITSGVLTVELNALQSITQSHGDGLRLLRKNRAVLLRSAASLLQRGIEVDKAEQPTGLSVSDRDAADALKKQTEVYFSEKAQAFRALADATDQSLAASMNRASQHENQATAIRQKLNQIAKQLGACNGPLCL